MPARPGRLPGEKAAKGSIAGDTASFEGVGGGQEPVSKIRPLCGIELGETDNAISMAARLGESLQFCYKFFASVRGTHR